MSNKTQLQANNTVYAALIEQLKEKAVGKEAVLQNKTFTENGNCTIRYFRQINSNHRITKNITPITTDIT